MILHPAFRVEPWALHETELHLDILAQSESLFALSNGHIGLRGNLDEGEPHGLPGTYLNGFYELRPLPYAEIQYGSPESSQTLVNVTNGKLMRLLVDDEPFDIRYGVLRSHDRLLDFRAGTLTRTAVWTSPAGRTVRVTSRRFVSFTHRSIVGISYELEPLDGPANIVVQSELVANEQLPSAVGDPRVAGAPESPLQSEEHLSRETEAVLIHRTLRSGLRLAAAMDHVISGTSKCISRRRRCLTQLVSWSPTCSNRDSACGWLSWWPTAGPLSAPCRRCAIRLPPPSQRPIRLDGTVCSPTSGDTSTTSGRAPTSSSPAIQSCNKRYALRCSTCFRPARGPRGAPFPPRD